MTTLLGTRRYLLGDRLDGGGFAAVHLAWDSEARDWRAVKRVSPEHATDRPVNARFDHEATLLTRIDHPHVVAADIWDEDPDGRLIVMELSPGGTLLGRLEEHGLLPAARAVSVGIQVCRGLAAVHALGVVHNDINPSSVLIDDASHVRIGSFHYAEENIGGVPDVRPDLVAVGVLLYVMITGHSPESADALVVERLPEPLGMVVVRAIGHGEAPFESAADLGDALERIAAQLEDRAVPPLDARRIALPSSPPEPPEPPPHLEALRQGYTPSILPQREPSRTDDATPTGLPYRMQRRERHTRDDVLARMRAREQSYHPVDDDDDEEEEPDYVVPTPRPAPPREYTITPHPVAPRVLSGTPAPAATHATRPPDVPWEEHEAPTSPGARAPLEMGALVSPGDLRGRPVGRWWAAVAAAAALAAIVSSSGLVGGVYIGSVSVTEAASLTRQGQGALYSTILDERDLIREIRALGGDAARLEALYFGFTDEKGDGRLEAAVAFAVAVSEVWRTTPEAAPGTTEERVRRVARAHRAYLEAQARWTVAAQSKLGQLAIALGVAEEPP